MYRMKKTKIVATMSDFRCTEEFVKNLYDAGMDVVRVNSAHVTEDGATHIVETVHRVNPAIPIMIDTKGPEIRVTTIADEYGNSINFRVGDRVAVRGSDGSDHDHPQGGLYERADHRARHSGRGAHADRRRASWKFVWWRRPTRS